MSQAHIDAVLSPLGQRMRRRDFIKVIAGSAAAWPIHARGQQSALPVIGFMSGRSPVDSSYLAEAFRQGLRGAGYVEGDNISIEYRWANGDYDRLPGLASDLLRRKVLVLVAVGGDSSALAAKQATSTVPIVFGTGSDPVKAGLVASFNKPGGQRHRIRVADKPDGAKADRASARTGTQRVVAGRPDKPELSASCTGAGRHPERNT